MAEMYGADTDEFLAQLHGKSSMEAHENNRMSKINIMGGESINKTDEDQDPPYQHQATKDFLRPEVEK